MAKQMTTMTEEEWGEHLDDFLNERARGNGREDQTSTAEPKFKLIPFDKITVSSTAVYLVKDIIPSTGIAVIWGPPKCGKSFWTLDLFMHVALDGWEYRGQRTKHGAVVYLAPEGGNGFGGRVEAFRRHHQLAGQSAPFFLVPAPINLVKDSKALIGCIRQQVGDEHKPVAVIIDTLNRSLVGSESDDKDMAAYIKAADAIGEAFGCVVPIVHHCGIEGNRPRGHTSLTGAAQAQLSVKRDATGNVIVEVEWMKDGQEGAKVASRLEVVEVGTDEYGEAITSCVVASADEILQSDLPQARKTARLPKSPQIALRALCEAVQELGVVPPVSNHIPNGVRTVTIDQWRQYAYARGISTGEGRAKQQAFKRATDLLIGNEHVGIWGEQSWPVA
jgi:AAA domain